MKLNEVKGMAGLLACSALGEDVLWKCEQFDLSAQDIQLFYARAGLNGHRQLAIDLVNQAQEIVIRALFDSCLPKGFFEALVLHESPPMPYMADEFVEGLVKLSPARRAACIYALENHLRPIEVTELLWLGLDLRGCSKTSEEVIGAARVLRHFKLPYVFWEWATKDIASPLLCLQGSIEKAFGIAIIDLQLRYDRMMMSNDRAECASFMSLVKQLDGG
jgi:hypothetical protein